jgi:DNA-binding MarR family transcriptional regulator
MSEPPVHPAVARNDTVHQRVRLGILTMLSEAPECTFAAVRQTLALTDGNLNRHVHVLEQAELIQVIKGYDGRRPCTWLRLTRQGRQALRNELAMLEQIVKRLRTTTPPR